MRTEYEVAIIGGGLAGLAASIQLSRKGNTVALFEKEKYPFHKVCGEYISFESWDFLLSLGVPLPELHLPKIDTLHLTAPNGKELFTKLPLGGFGISRYKLDAMLAEIAIENGVQLFQNAKVNEITVDEGYTIHLTNKIIKAKICCAAFGKRSNLDVKWKRKFVNKQSNRISNYVAVKYHMQNIQQENIISLHNFKNGYCGISKIEDDKYCLCYMTRAENLKECDNNIQQMEEKFLFQNPHLKKIFLTGKIVQQFPITISQISFSQKTKTENGILMLGDAAGMITPLCGNGMSIALHTSKIASALIDDCLQNRLTFTQLTQQYEQQWNKHFASRLKTGRMIQSFFGSNRMSNFFVGFFKTFPFLSKPVIRLTHGKPF